MLRNTTFVYKLLELLSETLQPACIALWMRLPQDREGMK